jgi:hypothetical protein
MEKKDFGNLYQPQLERPEAIFKKLFVHTLQIFVLSWSVLSLAVFSSLFQQTI